jgi:DNA-binding NarL/FixJ family response regulator
MNRKNAQLMIVEQSEMIGGGLIAMMQQCPFPLTVQRIPDLEALTDLPEHLAPELVIMNVQLAINRIRQVKSIRKSMPETKWLGLSVGWCDEELLSAFDGIIRINETADTIRQKIHEQLQTIFPADQAMQQDNLSERETEVLFHLVNGLQNKEIADKLNISIHTVISHRKNISLKTGIKSQAGLVIYALSNKLISLE